MLSLLEEHEEATIQTLKHLIVYPLVMRNPTKNLMISALPQQVPAEAAEGRGGKVIFFQHVCNMSFVDLPIQNSDVPKLC